MDYFWVRKSAAVNTAVGVPLPSHRFKLSQCCTDLTVVTSPKVASSSPSLQLASEQHPFEEYPLVLADGLGKYLAVRQRCAGERARERENKARKREREKVINKNVTRVGAPRWCDVKCTWWDARH